jgi:S-adenosylmethionine decarboxylase
MSEAPCQTEETVGLFAGQHVLAELSGVSADLLDDEQFLRHALGEVLTQADATVLEVISKKFDPQGVTVLALLSESHASIHTYPEVGSVFVDVFTCGTRAKPALAVQLLADALGAAHVSTDTVTRGIKEHAA